MLIIMVIVLIMRLKVLFAQWSPSKTSKTLLASLIWFIWWLLCLNGNRWSDQGWRWWYRWDDKDLAWMAINQQRISETSEASMMNSCCPSTLWLILKLPSGLHRYSDSPHQHQHHNNCMYNECSAMLTRRTKVASLSGISRAVVSLALLLITINATTWTSPWSSFIMIWTSSSSSQASSISSAVVSPR